MGALAKNLLAIEYIFSSPSVPNAKTRFVKMRKKIIKVTETGIDFV